MQDVMLTGEEQTQVQLLAVVKVVDVPAVADVALDAVAAESAVGVAVVSEP